MTQPALPPGPRGPSALQMLNFLRDPLGLLERCHARYGDLFTIAFGRKSMVLATSPELVKTIYRADPEVLVAGAAKATVFGPVVGASSVLVIDGDEHFRRRRLLIPAFRGERMLDYTDLMRRATEELLPQWPRDRDFALHPQVTKIAMLATIRGIFGEDLDPRLPDVLAGIVRDAIGSKLLFTPFLQRDFGRYSPWGKVLHAIHAADAVLYDTIAQRRRALDPSRGDTLSLLLQARSEEGELLSDQQLRDELVTLVAAGYEISSMSLAWCISDILTQPGVHAQLVAEIREVSGGEPIQSEHIPKLELVTAAIMESLRLHPPVAQGSVRLVKSAFVLGGYTLPPGTMVSVNIHGLHRRPDCHRDPLRFDLHRFMTTKPAPNTWVPFGGGTRRCLGMQLALHEFKVVVATLLQHFELGVVQDQILPERRGAFIFPSGGPLVRIHSVHTEAP